MLKQWCFAVQVSQRDVETEKRLKKDLRRTKVLLADAQIMLDHLKSNAPSKREIAQLKNQVCHSSERFTVSQEMMLSNYYFNNTFTGCLIICLVPPPSFPFLTAGGVRVHLCCGSEGPKGHGD